MAPECTSPIRKWTITLWRVAALLTLLTCGTLLSVCQLYPARAEEQQTSQIPTDSQNDQELVIENESELPDTYPHGPYLVHLLAHGGVPPLRWRVEKGALPSGIRLEENGVLRGEAEHAGEFQFSVSLTDSGKPSLAVQKWFSIRVREAFTLNWKSEARVNGNRIEGTAEVTNTTADDMDLTFIVLAVAGDGRATAIGYQHFVLRRGTMARELPFGEMLPRGGYVVHVDAIGEVETRKLIYRERLQTSGPLQVTVGP